MTLSSNGNSSRVQWKVVKDTDASAIDYDVGLNLRESSTSYEVGDIVYDEHVPSFIRLRCIQAGTSSAEELSIPS